MNIQTPKTKSTFEEAQRIIHGLVDDFQQGFSQFTHSSYSEASVRQDFLDKFFDALGWDVYHDIQKNPFYQEVKIERSQKQLQSKAQKRADYSFCIQPDYKNPKFFVEAKKPARNLRNSDDYFQTIRYGWNAGTGISILTDFEEFHIIDCRFEPDINEVFNAKHEIINYTNYKDYDTFSKIYWLFSREAVEAGNIEKYVADLPKPRGGSRQATLFGGRYKSIDESFLEYIDEVREKLAIAFKKNNPSLDSELLTEGVQICVDRLVFIRFLEDKLIEPNNYISELGNRSTSWKDFISACVILNVKYNGVVFKKRFIDDIQFNEEAEIMFSKICDKFSHLNNKFDFNYIPIHILGSIYERFLGKIVITTSKGVEIVEKPEVRKAGGVYYTPKTIVDYIIKNTIAKAIAGKNPKEISKLRFADISCGSGSFLIGVLEELLSFHSRYYNENPQIAEADKCHKVDGGYTLTIKQKQNILLNNIFGVDLDHQATEVTQVSLYLKMLEDETTGTANEMMVLFHEKILPDLSKNIKCGNSLIGTEILLGQEFQYAEEKKINAFDFEIAFPNVFKQGGFNVIVGNPPYVKEYTSKETFIKVKDGKLKKYYQGKMDLWYFFVCYGLDLLKDGGRLGYITPNNWVSNAGAKLLRNKIIKDGRIIELIDFNDYMVFKEASIQTMILLVERNKNSDSYPFKLQTFNQKKISATELGNELNGLTQGKCSEIRFPVLKRSKYQNKFLKFSEENIEKIFSKMTKLKNFELKGDSEIAQGIVPNPDILSTQGFKKISTLKKHKYNLSIGDPIFVVPKNSLKNLTSQEKEYLKPVYEPHEFKRYFFPTDFKKQIIYLTKANETKEIENLIHHLDKFKDVMNQRRETLQGKLKYFHLHWPRDESFFDKGEKILSIRKCESPLFVYTKSRAYVMMSFNIIKSERIDLKYLTGILNSNLIKFWLLRKGKMQGSQFQIDKEPLLEIPIFQTKDKKIEGEIINTVEQLLLGHSKLQSTESNKDQEYLERKCSTLESQLNKRIYELYNISSNETEIIEEILHNQKIKN
jgi:adenine-specific DNA-methyltransferase